MVAPLVEQYACKMPNPGVPAVDPATGQMSAAWWNWALRMFSRTGEQVGVGSTDTQSTADTALANAAAASATANSAQTSATAASIAAGMAAANAAAAQSTANTATTAIAAETTARIAADALLAPLASPSLTGAIRVGAAPSTIGFYGTAPIAKQTGVPVTAAGIHAALTALGLIAP